MQGDGEVGQGPGVRVRAGLLLGEGGPQGRDGLVQDRRGTGHLCQPVQGVPEAVQPPGALRGAGAERGQGLAQHRCGLLEQRLLVGVLGGQTQGDAEAGEQLGAVRVAGRAFLQGRAVDPQHPRPVGLVRGVLVPLPQGLGEVAQDQQADRLAGRHGFQCGAPQVEGLAQGAEIALEQIRVVAHHPQVAQVAESVVGPGRQHVERVSLDVRRALEVRGGGSGSGGVRQPTVRGEGVGPGRAAVDGDLVPRVQHLREGAERLRRGLGLLGEAGGPVEGVHRSVEVVGPPVLREPLLVGEAQEPYVLGVHRFARRPFTAQVDQGLQVVRVSQQLVTGLEGDHQVGGGPRGSPSGVRLRRGE